MTVVFGRRRNLRLSWLLAVAAFALLAAAYTPRLVTGFVADDYPVIVYLAKTSWAELLTDDFWGVEGGAGRFRPVLHLSAKLDVVVFGTWAFGFQLVNLLLHCATALLLGRLIVDIALLWTPRAAFIGVVCAGLWLLHPVNAEVVGWFAARGNILGLLFSLLALVLWQRRRGEQSVAFTFCAALLAHFSHEMVFLLPFVAVAIAFVTGRRRRWSNAAATFAVFVAAFAVSAAVRAVLVDEAFGGELTQVLRDVPRAEWPRLLWAALRSRVEILLVPVHGNYLSGAWTSWLWWVFAIGQVFVLVLGGLQIRRAPFLAICAVGAAFVAPSALTIIDSSSFTNSRQLYAATVPYCVLVATALSVLRKRPRVVLALVIGVGYGLSTLGVNVLRAGAANDVVAWRNAAYRAVRAAPEITRLEFLDPPLVRDGMLVLENAAGSFFSAPWYAAIDGRTPPVVHVQSSEQLLSLANGEFEERNEWLATGVAILRQKGEEFSSHILPREVTAPEFAFVGPRAGNLRVHAWAVPAVRIEGEGLVRMRWIASDGAQGEVLPFLMPASAGGGLLYPLGSDIDCLLAGELRALEFVGGIVRKGASLSKLPELTVTSPDDDLLVKVGAAPPRFVASPLLHDVAQLTPQTMARFVRLRFMTSPAAFTVPGFAELVDGSYVFVPAAGLQASGKFAWGFFVDKVLMDPRVKHVWWCFEERDLLDRVVARSKLRRLLPKR